MKLEDFNSKYELVIVEWDDISTQHGWNTPVEMHSFKPMHCISVGFLLADEPHQLLLCSGYADDGDMADVTSIPKGTILKVTYIGERKNEKRKK